MLLLLAAALQATAVPPAPPPVAAPATVAPAKKVKERQVCRTLDDSSSRMGRRVCQTVSEWNNDTPEVGGSIAGARGSQPSESGN